jgi:hypothetical protein
MRGLLLILLVACGTKSTPPVPPTPPPDAAIDAPTAAIAPDAPPASASPLDRDLPRLAQRSVALYEAVVATFRTAGADCAAATKRLGELRTEYADVTAANAKVLHEGRARDLKAALVPFDDKLDAAAREIVGSQTMSKCTSDRAFTRSFDDLVGAPP